MEKKKKRNNKVIKIKWIKKKKRKKERKYYGTVTNPFMDSSKFYINRETSTLENIGYSTGHL